jgi:uncharacterized protein YjbJ (UPF0337 family)
VSVFEKAKAEAESLVGKAKQAIGKVTDNQSLTNTGRRQEASGEAKKQVQDVKARATEAARAAKDKLTGQRKA